MINVADLPAVRDQLESDIVALKERHAQRAQDLVKKQAPQFSRAPAASASEAVGGRPPAIQGRTR